MVFVVVAHGFVVEVLVLVVFVVAHPAPVAAHDSVAVVLALVVFVVVLPVLAAVHGFVVVVFLVVVVPPVAALCRFHGFGFRRLCYLDRKSVV